MKIKNSWFLLVLSMTAILLLSKCFFLIESYDAATVIGVLLLGVFFSLFFAKKKMAVISHNIKFIYYYCISAIVIYSIIILYSSNVYSGQSIISTFHAFFYYYSVILVIPLMCYLLYKMEENRLLAILNVLAILAYIVIFVQFILYQINGAIILPGYFANAINENGELFGTGIRNDSVRIDITVFGNIMILYNFYNYYIEKKQRIFSLVMFLVGMFELIFIQQTRMYTMIIIAILFVIVFKQKSTKSTIAKRIMLIVCVVAFVFTTNIVQEFMYSFVGGGMYENTTFIRLDAAAYYLTYVWNHLLFGMGFVNGELHSTIAHGPLGTFWQSDVGIVGQMSYLGIFIVPIYIVLLVRFAYIIKKLRQLKDEQYLLYYSFFLYILLTSTTLIMLDTIRIVLYPISIVLFEFKYYYAKTHTKKVVVKGNENGKII